jgi:hypothetical protein
MWQGLVKLPAGDRVMTPLLRATPYCCICGMPVQLSSCKFDERGQPVHEDCYVAKLLLDSKGDGYPSFPSRYKTSAKARPELARKAD